MALSDEGLYKGEEGSGLFGMIKSGLDERKNLRLGDEDRGWINGLVTRDD